MKMYAGLLLLLFATACTARQPAPQDPSWNHDYCTHCRMAISEPRFAVQLIGPGSRVRYYDDLGCALADQEEHPELKAGTIYVRPNGDNQWIRAQESRYEEKLETPMGYGFGAVKAGGDLSFDNVQSKFRARKQK